VYGEIMKETIRDRSAWISKKVGSFVSLGGRCQGDLDSLKAYWGCAGRCCAKWSYAKKGGDSKALGMSGE